MTTRVVYMGTPAFAVPALEALAARSDTGVVLVVTQPDRPAGRGKKLTPPAVKEAAEALNLPVLQVDTLRDADARIRIQETKADLVVVAAFGMILGNWILEMPTYGCINLHASLLPAYRGANPIAAAIAAGEAETGVSVMRMDRGLDTGPILAKASCAIRADDTTESLTPRLAMLGAELLKREFENLISGRLDAVPQTGPASLTRQMTKADGWLDWSRPAVALERQVRAMWPWPRAYTTTPTGERVQVHAATCIDEVPVETPGTVRRSSAAIDVACSEGWLRLERVQVPGGKPVHGNALMQVRGLENGDVLGSLDVPSVTPLVRDLPSRQGE